MGAIRPPTEGCHMHLTWLTYECLSAAWMKSCKAERLVLASFRADSVESILSLSAVDGAVPVIHLSQAFLMSPSSF